MSRQIEFRAWDKRNKEMVYSSKEDSFYINTKCALFMYYYTKLNDYYRDYELDQFTGLLDKNGTKIYEGDVVEYLYSKENIIVWDDKRASFKIKTKYDGDSVGITEFNRDEVEVIGNIHKEQ
jgi:uncharacterized phage protein (TIGR01671 family)